jgi:hypothetical protein
MKVEPLREQYKLAQYILIVLFLLGQFFLRVHNPLEQPAFVDESHHIQRGGIVYTFDRNPVELSHGKLLFYYWLGLFLPGGDSALATGRLAVAVFSLITSAVIAALARALFGERAILPALVFYALAPWTVFFERMALADSFAGGLAALTAWQCIRLARSPAPTRRFGAWIGLLVAATMFGKMTTIFVSTLPFAAVLLSDIRPAGYSRADLRAWLFALWARFGLAWVAAAITVGVVWVIYLIGLLAYQLSGQTPMVFTGSLVDGAPGAPGMFSNVRDTLIGARYLLSIPMTAGLIALTAMVVRQRAAATAFVLVWLAALWGPVIVWGNPVKTRYLMTGLPVLAVLFGGGIASIVFPWKPFPARNQPRGWQPQPGPVRFQLAIVPPQLSAVSLAVLTVVLFWAFDFALPFAQTAATDPEDLDLMARDEYSYITSPYNGFAARDAVAFLAENGARFNGEIPAVGALKHCGSISLYITHQFAWSCYDERTAPEPAFVDDISHWANLATALDQWPLVYLITEYQPPSGLAESMGLDWRPMFTDTRPRSGWTVTVWRVARHHN